MYKPILFLDRDGTLIEEPADFQVDEISKVRLVKGVIPALLELRDCGYRFVLVSNQDGLGTDSFPRKAFESAHGHMLQLFNSQGIDFEQEFICPHLLDEKCACRKPATGLLTRYLAQTAIDTRRSAVVGDRNTDIELAENLGVRGFLLDPSASNGHSWRTIADELCNAPRRATVKRKTKETDIEVAIALDVSQPVSISTGIGFFDHMLEQVAKHSGCSVSIRCAGDLEIDEHHTVEDVALSLGEAFRQALGDKRGIGRYGFALPMDEAQARVVLDLSGRAASRFEANFPRDNVGEMSTEMVQHFFKSLADALGAALHIEVDGENTHHMVEACFKAVGRALRQAVARGGNDLPSTKGVL